MNITTKTHVGVGSPRIHIHESVDPTWPKTGVSVPWDETRWFDDFEQAHTYASQLAKTHGGTIISLCGKVVGK